MSLKSEQVVLKAHNPSEIFSMNKDTLDEEKNQYIKRFKPKPYRNVENYILMQKVTILYREALEILSKKQQTPYDYNLHFESIDGERYDFKYYYSIRDDKFAKMYLTDTNIVLVISKIYKMWSFNRLKEIFKSSNLKFIDTINGSVIIIDKQFDFYILSDMLYHLVHEIEDIIDRKNKFITMYGEKTANKLFHQEELVSEDEKSLLPVIGKVIAGEPIIETQNEGEYLSVCSNPILASSIKNDSSMLRMHGQSMVNYGINDGDFIAVSKQSDIKDGEIVIAMIDGKALVSKYYKKENYIMLESETCATDVIISDNFEIMGKVVGLFRE